MTPPHLALHLATAQQLLRDMLRDGAAEHGDAAHYLKAAVLAMEREAREAGKREDGQCRAIQN